MKDFAGRQEAQMSNSIKTLIFFLNLRRALTQINSPI